MYKILCDGEIFCDSRLEELAIINPTGTVGANAAGTFSFTIAPNHPHYDMIQRKSSIISVYRDSEDEPIFQGICTAESVDFFGQKTLSFEGELTYFNDSVQRQAHYSSRTPRQLLEALVSVHNSQVGADKQFTVGIVTVTGSLTCYTNYESTMTCLKEDLTDDLGGYIRVRYANGVRYVDYLKDGARTSNQTIRLGQNLLDYTSNIDDTQIATCIIPLGAKSETQVVSGLDAFLTIESAPQDEFHPAGADYVYSQSAVAAFGWISQVVNWDDVTVVSNLLSKAEDYLQNIQFNNVVLQVAAVDLAKINDSFDAFRVLDQIRVISEPHGMNRLFLATELSFDLNNPESDQIVLGTDITPSISTKTTEALKIAKKAATPAFVEEAVDNATALITGAKGGYVIIERNSEGQPSELRIQNALENPQNIWRWNINGLGYSDDGGETYGLAMTMDGSIVADYITTGKLRSIEIDNGDGDFTVDEDGNMTAQSGTIAGFTMSKTNKRFEVYDADTLSGYIAGNANGLTLFGENMVMSSTLMNLYAQSLEITDEGGGTCDVTISGDLSLNGHAGNIGDVTTKTNSSAVTLTTGTWTNSQCYVNVKPGVFEFHVRATFAAAAGKRRGVRLYNALTAAVISDSTLVEAGPATSQTITLKTSTPVEITEQCNVYLQVYQDTGSDLNVTSSNIRCVRYR